MNITMQERCHPPELRNSGICRSSPAYWNPALSPSRQTPKKTQPGLPLSHKGISCGAKRDEKTAKTTESDLWQCLAHLNGCCLLCSKGTDEGFGTLDADTLDIALNALDTLNASGKMTGAISDLEGMKEGIPAQIRVENGGGVGYSLLRI